MSHSFIQIWLSPRPRLLLSSIRPCYRLSRLVIQLVLQAKQFQLYWNHSPEMLSLPFNTACLCGVGSDGRKKNKVIHNLLPRRQLQHKRCLRKQNNLFVWPQLCELWPVLIFRGGYVWHFCPQVELNVEKKKNNTMHLYIFFNIIADNLKTLGICFKLFFIELKSSYLLLFKSNKDFHEIPSLLRIWDALGYLPQ